MLQWKWVEELGVCFEVLEAVSLAFVDGILVLIRDWVLSVHAEGGGFEVGKDSTNARKGIGLGPSIRCTRRESFLPKFMVSFRVGQDKAR